MVSDILDAAGMLFALVRQWRHTLLLYIRNCLLILNLISFSSLANASSFAPYFDLSVLGDMYAVSSSQDLNNGQLHGRFKLLSQKENLNIYFDLGAGGLLGKKAESYFMLPQAYVGYRFSDSWTLTLGRILKNYSHMDDYWMLGDVQPLFRWDAGRPEVQGLPGLFLDYKGNKNVEWSLFASGLFLPSQGPSFSIVGGKLTSGNPWFSRPVDVLALSGTPYDLVYSINTPDVSKIILQPSFGTSVTLKSDNENFWLRGGYFVKSRNELVLPFEGALNLTNNTGDISVHPRVAQHKLATLDLGYKSETWAATLSGIKENDVKFDIDPAWIYPVFSDQYKVAANILYHVTAFHTLELGGLKTFNNHISVLGLTGADNLDIYSFRNQYENAVDVRFTSVFMPRQHGFLFKTRARAAYDYTAETTLLSMEVVYSPFADMSCFVRGDLFGGERPVNKSYNNLLVNYLNNDRIQMGVKYVF